MPDLPLRAQLAEALRRAAFDCPGDCGLTEQDCDREHPIQPAVWHFDAIADITGDVDAIATVMVAVVQPELDRLRALHGVYEAAQLGNLIGLDEESAVATRGLLAETEAELHRYRSAWQSARRRAWHVWRAHAVNSAYEFEQAQQRATVAEAERDRAVAELAALRRVLAEYAPLIPTGLADALREAGQHAEFGALLDASSLGAPGVLEAAARTSRKDRDAIMARVRELEAATGAAYEALPAHHLPGNCTSTKEHQPHLWRGWADSEPLRCHGLGPERWTVPCGTTLFRTHDGQPMHPHHLHDWEPQPGEPLVRCPGTYTTEEP